MLGLIFQSFQPSLFSEVESCILTEENVKKKDI